MSDMTAIDDRRRSKRQQWIRMESRVHIRRSLFKKEWISVVPFDFSRYGMGIQTDEAYEIGGTVSLSLKLIREESEIDIPAIKGIVRYKEKHHSRFNYGVEFTFASRNEKLLLEPDLMRIEQALRAAEVLKSTQS